MKRKRKRLAIVPRLGVPQNLRPAGAHVAKTFYNRKKQKAALRRYDEDGFFVYNAGAKTLRAFAVVRSATASGVR